MEKKEGGGPTSRWRGRKKGGEFWVDPLSPGKGNLNALNENQLFLYCWICVYKTSIANLPAANNSSDNNNNRPIHPESLLSIFYIITRSLLFFFFYLKIRKKKLMDSHWLFSFRAVFSFNWAFIECSPIKRRATLMPSNNSPPSSITNSNATNGDPLLNPPDKGSTCPFLFSLRMSCSM